MSEETKLILAAVLISEMMLLICACFIYRKCCRIEDMLRNHDWDDEESSDSSDSSESSRSPAFAKYDNLPRSPMPDFPEYPK